MMKFNRLIIFIFLMTAATSTFADLTIHLLNPWAKDSTRANSPVYIQSSESGWYPGAQMTSDFGNWLTYTFKNSTATSNDNFRFMSVISTADNSLDKPLNYTGGPTQIIFKNIFTGHENSTDIWLVVNDTTKFPQLQFISPPYKVFRFFKPWEIGGATIEIKNIGSFRMKGLGDYCGWLTFKLFTDQDSLNVKFRNTIDNTYYSSSGPGDGAYINLSTIFAKSDTVWVLASLAGPPSVGSVFPGKLGDCSPITLASKLRDMSDSTHPDFNKGACSSGKIAFPGLVNKRLVNGKPVKSNIATCLSTQVGDWFKADTLAPGYTNEQCYNLTMQKNDEGLYTYDTSDFFPLDSFQYLDAKRTILNPNGILRYGHNFSFTMETGAEFEYVKGQQFYFRGDDDVWVFIDSMLVVDLGGIHYPIEGSVNLDTLGLIPGKTYSFKLFFCERNCCGSSFRMVTSIALRTSSKLYHKDTLLTPGTTQYDMYEKITKDNMACDASNEIPIDTIKASVEFYIEGSPFSTPLKLSSGTSYGGITILPDYTGVIIDQLSINGLAAGDYQIHYYSTRDKAMEGVLRFTVTAVPKIDNPVKNAAYFSDNGNGSVNRAEIYFTDTLKTLPDSILLFWPSVLDRKLVTSGAVLDPLNKRHITIHLADPFPKEITTYSGSPQLGRCYFYDPTYTSHPLTTVPFSIADSVGPLIKSALLIERIEPGNDTLLLTFSELLKDSSLIGKSLILFKDGKKITLNVLKTFPKGDSIACIIEDQKENAPGIHDSIAFNSAGPVRDAYGNSPHNDNRPVPFLFRPVPRKNNPVKNAAYFSDNGNGSVDRAEIYFTDTLKRLPDSLYLFWPSDLNRKLITSGIVIDPLNKRHITVRLTDPFPKEITTYKGNTQLGRCYFYDSIYTSNPLLSVPFSIADSVGPLIKSALLIERIEPGNDTILLTFTELLTNTSLEGKSLVLFKAGKKITLNVLKTFPKGDSTVCIIEDQKENSPGIHDSIAFSSAGPVRDSYGNPAREDNRPVPFLFRKIPGKLIKAYYLDPDADGIVDKAILKFNKNVTRSEFTATFNWINKFADLDSTKFSFGKDSSEINVNLSGAFSQQIQTSGEMSVHIESTSNQGGQEKKWNRSIIF